MCNRNHKSSINHTPDYLEQKTNMAKFNIYEWKQSIKFMIIVGLELCFPNWVYQISAHLVVKKVSCGQQRLINVAFHIQSMKIHYLCQHIKGSEQSCNKGAGLI